MKYVGTAAACGMLASSSLAQAIEIPGTFSGNIGFASEYVWQGISMSAGKPTINGGFDWDSGNHWYVSLWGSNVDYYDTDEARFGSFYITGTQNAQGFAHYSSDDYANLELDFYVGYWGYIGGGYNTPYDLGVGYYVYPGARSQDRHWNSATCSLGCNKFDVASLGKPATFDAWGTGDFAQLYAGLGHYFLDDRVKTMAYLSYTNDYNGQNQDEWEVYADTEVYLSYAITLRLHAGYTWGEYWQKNLFGYNTNPGLSYTDRTWGWCGYTYARGAAVPKNAKYATGTAKNDARYYDCVEGSGKDDDFFDWGIGLSRSFGQFDFTLDYIWVTGLDNEDQVKSWWSGMDQDGANNIYTDGQFVAAVKMAL